MTYRLSTFGSLTLVYGSGIPVPVLGLHRLSLATVLATSGTTGVCRPKLEALFWPECDRERARASLKQAVYIIRRVLGPECLQTTASQLILNRAFVTSDIAEFQDAAAAHNAASMVDLATAPFLDGLHLTGAPEFERWCAHQRHRIDLEVREAIQTLGEEAAIRGDTLGRIRWLERLVQHDPADTDATLRLIEALSDDGQFVRAVRAADDHSRWLENELELPHDGRIIARRARLLESMRNR